MRYTTIAVAELTSSQRFIDPHNGLTYSATAIAGPDHILAVADKGKDMFFPLDYRVIPAHEKD